MFKQAIELEPKDSKCLLKWANCLLELSKAEERQDRADELLKESFSLFDRAKKTALSDAWKTKVLLQWGNAHLQQTKTPVARFQRQGLLQSSSLDDGSYLMLFYHTQLIVNITVVFIVEAITNSLECFREAVALGCHEFPLLHSMAIAYSKLARTQYGEAAMKTFTISFQHFSSAATLQSPFFQFHTSHPLNDTNLPSGMTQICLLLPFRPIIGVVL